MKKIPALFVLACLCIQTKAQKKDFEGRIAYKVTVSSNSKDADYKFLKLLYAANGDKQVTAIKNGMIKQSLGLYEAWYIGKSKRLYLKFRNIDTLFYRDYSDDTSKVAGIVKSDSSTTIQGYPCKSILLKKENSTALFLYTDALQYNTEFEKDNTLENMDVLIREIGTGMWLYSRTVYPWVSVTDSCLRVDQSAVEDQLFDLPAIPQKKFTVESLMRRASFRGGSAGWTKYLQNNLNGNLGLRYIKMPKGEKEASVQVQVSFDVAEDGSLSNIIVTNKSEVNSHLANEAMRVVRESPPWEAATIYGVKTKMTMTQPVNFKIAQ
jgi:TonB family protein